MDLNLQDALRIGGREFIVLGLPLHQTGETLADVKDKILGNTRNSFKSVWGTLGWANDAMKASWEGRLQLSGEGNDRLEEREPTGEEAALIGRSFPEAGGVRAVRERFVNFDLVDFKRKATLKDLAEPKIDADDAPYLRLTVMVPPDEGALVFYQFAGRRRDDDTLEYIQPESTDDAHDTNQRDRLTYLFSLLPPSGNNKMRRFNFVVKILTFKRNGRSSGEVLERVGSRLFDSFGKRTKFMIYRPGNNVFVEEDRPDFDKKTLLLLHGTFSETIGSFDNLLHERDWIQKMAGAGGVYEQIVGFDHRTVFDGLDDNRLKLMGLLGGNRFAQPVDVMTTSRGGLLLKELITREDSMRALNIERAVTMACSNGVGLLRIFHAARFLTFMRYFLPIFMPWNAFVSALAQHSTRFMLKLPGLACQHPDNVEELLNRPLALGQPVTIFPVVGDYRPKRNREHKFFRRLLERGVEGLISIIYGPHHDWVVQARRQVDTSPAQTAVRVGDIDPRNHTFNSKHSDYLMHPEVLSHVETFLRMPLH